MPYSDPDDARRKASASRSSKKYYEANKQYYMDQAAKRREALKVEIRALKEASPCIDCGVNYPYYVMQHDHLGDKVEIVSRLVNKGVSRKRIMDEIAKCELVCANCHAIRTHERRVAIPISLTGGESEADNFV